MKEERIIIEIGERLKDVLMQNLEIISSLAFVEIPAAISKFNDNFMNCLTNIKSEK